MAVFTKLDKTDIEKFLSLYDIGYLDTFSEIIEGIENTNYKIVCSGTSYILTIFEKRVKEEELPFFMDLKLYLHNNNFKCPKPIKNKNGEVINSIKNKKASIISYIKGEKINIPKDDNCNEVGKMVGSLHNLTKNYTYKRKNSLDIVELKNIFLKFKDNKEKKFELCFYELKNEIDFLEKSLPKNLPSGIIHADLFKDNIFFEDEKISGVIDFYFSCYHFFLYDICIIINDWCFEKNGEIFLEKSFKAVIEGYNSMRKLTNDEIEKLNIILRLAAVRILVTRIYDYIFHPKDAVVIKKDPFQYYNILKWHQNNKNLYI